MLALYLVLAASTAGKPASKITPCGNPATLAGGITLPIDHDGQLWFRVAGKSDAPTVIVVHGGPGSNSYNFEQSLGAFIEPSLRVVYLDQRGSGRSVTRAGKPEIGMQRTLDDLERVRQHLGVDKVFLLAHSFGGAIALEYQRTQPTHVAGLVLVDTAANMSAALEHQVQTLGKLASARFADHGAALKRIAADKAPVSTRLGQCYAELGRLPLQRAIVFSSDAAQQKLEGWDADNAFTCRADVAEAFIKEGWLDAAKPTLERKLDCRAIVFAGRLSDVIGFTEIERSAKAWGAPIVWFEHSGHFPNIEEPELFGRELVAFVLHKD